MIDFRQVWLPQILRYAELIREESVLARAWREGRTDETSVTTPDELFVQVFDDLDSEAVIQEALRHLRTAPGLVDALGDFLIAIKVWDRERGGLAESLFQATSWANLQARARRLLVEAVALDPRD